MLASIAHSSRRARYGPWEQFASMLTEGLVARGPRRHPLRHRGLGDVRDGCTPRRRRADKEDPTIDPKVAEASTSQPCSSGRTSST